MDLTPKVENLEIVHDSWEGFESLLAEVNEEVDELLDWMDLDEEQEINMIRPGFGGYVVVIGGIVVAMGTLAECKAWLRKAVA